MGSAGRKKSRPVPVAVIGEGPPAERLAAAYGENPHTALAAMAPPDKAQEILAIPGLKGVEITASGSPGLEIALQSLKKGFFTSVELPEDSDKLRQLQETAVVAGTTLRIRMLPLYYPPYRELKKLVAQDHIGRPINLRLSVKWGRGLAGPGVKPREALIREAGFLALAPWIMGPVAEVYARIEEGLESGHTPSAVVAWKHEERSRYGYLQLDFCPQLHIRSEDQPVHRMIQLTGLGGIVTASRGEGQLMRAPALTIRSKNATTSFETLPDKWSEVYTGLAAELAAVVRKRKPVLASPEKALTALNMLETADLKAPL